MESHPRISAESSWLYRLLSPGPVRVTLTGGTIQFVGRYGEVRAKIMVGDIASITISPSWYWNTLAIRLKDGAKRSIGGLDKREAELIQVAAQREAAQVREAEVAEAVRTAKVMNSRLAQLDEKLRQLFAGNRYARYHHSLKLHETVMQTLRECVGLIREHLEPDARETLDHLKILEPVETFETARRNANRNFVSNQVASVQAAALAAVSNPLTNEQAESVATDEDVTLVLAGAGTGKTSVIVGKVAHLVRNQGVPPHEILVLAFNRKAAKEIRNRLPGDLSKAQVSTFHSFGLRVIGAVERSKLDIFEEHELVDSLKDILNELLDDEQESESTANNIASYGQTFESPFGFESQDEYNAYRRSVRYQTMSGDRVRSLQELAIANYLYSHGLNFCYERPYEVRTETKEYRQYRPDFYLSDYGIYIEHQALDEFGNPPPHFSGYKEKVEWQRRTHISNGTKLIETYSWQHQKGILFDELSERLQREGVRLKRVSHRELVLGLARQLIEWLARLIAKFLNHFKTNGLSSKELISRADSRGTLWRDGPFLHVFERVLSRYEQRLRDKGKLDFHDMISRAAQYIREGRWKTYYRYVLVDEFQDISMGRMKLLQALKRDNTAYFLVGDDWQSINRFAGSDMSLLRRCDDYLGHVQHRNLRKTFRFGDGILNPSSEFVRRNPEQTQRALTSVNGTEDKGITVIWATDPAVGLGRAREDISKSPRGVGHTLLALGRYNFSGEALQDKEPSEEFSTVHRAKGREADYVVVLDLKEGRWGFPSRIEDNPLLELVLPPAREGVTPFPEERRLFYVAMTRARIGTYLVANPVWPSTFVTELIAQSDDLRQVRARAKKCPRCEMGLLWVKDGKYGQFWGCSEYRAELRCRYTENIETDTKSGAGNHV